MALSKKDIEIIKDLLKESSDDLRNELRVEMKFLKTEISQELRTEFMKMFNALKIYMDIEFKRMDTRFDRLEETVGYHDAQLKEMERN